MRAESNDDKSVHMSVKEPFSASDTSEEDVFWSGITWNLEVAGVSIHETTSLEGRGEDAMNGVVPLNGNQSAKYQYKCHKIEVKALATTSNWAASHGDQGARSVCMARTRQGRRSSGLVPTWPKTLKRSPKVHSLLRLEETDSTQNACHQLAAVWKRARRQEACTTGEIRLGQESLHSEQTQDTRNLPRKQSDSSLPREEGKFLEQVDRCVARATAKSLPWVTSRRREYTQEASVLAEEPMQDSTQIPTRQHLGRPQKQGNAQNRDEVDPEDPTRPMAGSLLMKISSSYRNHDS